MANPADMDTNSVIAHAAAQLGAQLGAHTLHEILITVHPFLVRLTQCLQIVGSDHDRRQEFFGNEASTRWQQNSAERELKNKDQLI